MAVALVLVGSLAGCASSLSGGARETFARIAGCAGEKVTVVAAPDYRAPVRPSPPDEATDPGRLAYWEQRRSGGQKKQEMPEPECTMFEASGCGQRFFVCCRHPMARDSTGAQAPRTGETECEQRSDSAGSSGDAGDAARSPSTGGP